MVRHLIFACACIATSLSIFSEAEAALPHPVRMMIEEAIRLDDPAKVETVVEIARTTNPGDIAEIDTLREEYRRRRAVIDQRNAELARSDIREAGLLRLWKGKGELGAFRSTGNSSNIGIAIGLTGERKGIDWEHRIRARFDYQNDGRVEREQYFLSYRPRHAIGSKHFIFGLAQYENDRFQGFDGRYSVSGGLGYRAIDQDRVKLALEAGPALRVTDFVNAGTEERISGLGSIDLEWRPADSLKLTHDAAAYVESDNSTLNLVTAIEAGVGGGLVARISYSVEHETNPPDKAIETDTLSRFTLVYGF